MDNNFDFLRRPKALILTVILLIQAVTVYGFRREEVIPDHRPLAQLSQNLGPWRMVLETPMDKETAEVLKADDTVNRTYVDTQNGFNANLFVAFFKTQRAGQAPHSPKNCLPGSGWVPSLSDTVTVEVPGREAMKVNRYIVQKGEAQSLVLYWYQSRDRVVASEYEAKFYVVADALRYNRTDTALVRVVIGMPHGRSTEDAMKSANDFIRSFYAPLRQHFPA